MENEKIGLVLSGGGIRGIAHVGLLQALKEADIQVDHITGSSAGALVGALHLMDYQSEEILEVFAEVQIYSYSRFTWRKLGFLDSETFIPHLQRYFPIDNFSVLNCPLTVTMTDLEAGTCEYVSTGELIRPLLASAAYPPTLSPMQIGEKFYMDGGIMDNFPIKPLIGKSDIIIGSHVCPVQPIKYKDISYSGQLAWRAVNLSYFAASQDKFDQCDFVFQPREIDEVGVFDNKMVKKVYEIGYQQAKQAIPEILAVVNAKREAKVVEMEQYKSFTKTWYGKMSGLFKSLS
ncbi:MAG: patatin-like phospholipase family protein [Saprospiraceae bacterium]